RFIPRSTLGWSITRILRGVDVEGRLIMVRDYGLHPPILEGLINAGAAGLLIINTGSDALPPSETVVTGLADTPTIQEIPIFNVHPRVAEAILSEAGMSLAELQLDSKAEESSRQWDFDLRIRMRL